MKMKRSSIALVIFIGLTVLIASSGVVFAQAIQPGAAAQMTAAIKNTTTQVPNNFNCTILGADPCTSIVNFILSLVKGAMGLLVSFGGVLIQIGMSLTSTVYSSQAVQSGFGAMLAIANLVFVLAIIVIAVATILRSETYGYKKTLWRLIAMAILVNFGLVITAPIVGFANSITNYFVASVKTTTTGANTNAIVTFSNTLMQKTNAAALQGAVPTNTNSTGGISVAGAVFQTLFSLIFIIVFEGLIALTFILLGLLLVVRYVYLVVLLVLLPIAWVSWIFPNFSHQWSEWWKKFIHWTFFPPAAMFFVWLAVSIQTNFSTDLNAQNGPATAFSTATGLASNGSTSAGGILAQMMNSLVVIGVMIGGLMAASKLADGAGKFAVAQGKAVSGAVTGYVGKQTKKAGRLAYQKAGGQKVATALQQGRFGLRSIPLLGRGASLAGRGLSSISTNEKLVEDAKKKVPKNPQEIKERLMGSMNMEDQLAHIAKLVEMGELTTDTKVNGKVIGKFLDDNKDNGVLERYGQGKLEKDANKEIIGDGAMRKAEEAHDITELNAATKKFIVTLGKADIAKMNVNGVFAENTESTRILLSNIAQSNPALLPGILAKAKGSVGETIGVSFRKITDDEKINIGRWEDDPVAAARGREVDARITQLTDRLVVIQADANMNAAQKGDAIDKADDEIKKLRNEKDGMQNNYVEKKLNDKYHKDIFDKAMANNVLSPPNESGTPTPPPSPAPAGGSGAH